MELDALEKLQEAAQIEQLLAAIKDGAPAAPVPHGFELRSLEKYYPVRDRFRGSLKTTQVATFTGYLRTWESTCPVFINPERMEAAAYLDLGDANKPGHCGHSAGLSLTKTAPYIALLKLSSAPRNSQREAVELIEDHWDHWRALREDGSEIPLEKALAALRRVNIKARRDSDHSVGNLSQTRSTLESVEASSEQGIPHRLVFRCKPYQDLSERDFICRVGISPQEDECLIIIKPIGLEAHAEAMADEFAELLKTELADTSSPLYIGTFNPA